MNINIALLKKLAAQKNLLIVEDELEVIESLSRLLSRFFNKIYTATNALEAIEIFKSLEDTSNLLTLTDINLGSQSGVDLTCIIKKMNPLNRVIAISATEQSSIFIESIKCGIDRFILKPINQETLFDTLIIILKKMNYDQELKKNQKLLEESREYALKLLKEQDQFLKNAIHEIHTPLAVIITNIDLLRMNGIHNESLDAIEAGSRIIQNSYEDMTYLMKNNHVSDVKKKINLVEFIAERKRYFHCIVEVNELTVSMFVGQLNLPLINFSELKLARLIDNTLSNAIKYSHRPSQIHITVGMQAKKLFFEITNHGPLIVDKSKIFERFHRESEHNGGYGLGLSIVAQICQEEKVDIKIISTKERGTSFRYIFNNATQLQHNSSTIAHKE